MSTFANTVDELDAEVFSGDALEFPENRELFVEHLKRWMRALQVRDDFTIADGYICVDAEDGTFDFPSGDRQMTNDRINDRIQLSVDNGLDVPVMHIIPFVLVK